MKTILTSILVAMAIVSQAQFVNLEWVKRDIKAQNWDMPKSLECKDYLEYNTQVGYISYHFIKEGWNYVCVRTDICLDSTSAKYFLRDRINQEWRELSKDHWIHYSGIYHSPVLIEADRRGSTVTFSYTLQTREFDKK